MLSQGQDSDTLRDRMLECSELRIEEAANSPDRHASRAALRVLECPRAWHDWEVSHRLHISFIATQRNSVRQSQALKRMALWMIHRKAPFEFLREHTVRGGARQRFFQLQFGSNDYASAMVREHRSYLKAMCSYLCVDRFCGSATLHRIRDYECRYSAYWTLQVQAREREVRGETLMEEVDADALQSLRLELTEARERLLSTHVSAADRHTLEELRQPTGDTVRIHRPSFAVDYEQWEPGR